MSVIRNEVRRGTYQDSVALMRIARALEALPGVEVAGLMIGTPANLEILRGAGVLNDDGAAAGAGDIVVALRAAVDAQADAAIAEARRLLDKPRAATGIQRSWRPRTLRSAIEAAPASNLALISVPGDFAIAEARKAIRAGLDVMIFSDNVSLADEADLKHEANRLGRLVMGPDCGTAIIGGAPLAFANVVPRGDIAIVGASGTGIQEVSCLIAQAGHGVSHAIGTGGRDLKAEIGGLTTLAAIDLLDADPSTRHVVLISKPPAAEIASRVLARVGRSTKPFTICFLGGTGGALPANALAAATLAEAAHVATGARSAPPPGISGEARAGIVRGLFAGGTLAAEAQIAALAQGLAVSSNAPVPGAAKLGDPTKPNVMLDLGADEYTRGRPHPMIEPSVRDEPLRIALADPAVAVVLLDCVLGFGSHMDPAGHLASRLVGRAANGPVIVASVTGTDGDPQNRAAQVAKLTAAGVIVAPSNAAAASIAAGLVRRDR